MRTKLNPEDFTDESSEMTTYDDLLAALDWLNKVPKENLVYLIVNIVSDADNKEELLEYIANYFDE